MQDLSRPILSREIESVVKQLPMKKNTGPHDFNGEYY